MVLLGLEAYTMVVYGLSRCTVVSHFSPYLRQVTVISRLMTGRCLRCSLPGFHCAKFSVDAKFPGNAVGVLSRFLQCNSVRKMASPVVCSLKSLRTWLVTLVC